jgi:endoglucanase
VAANYGLQLLVANAMQANRAYVNTAREILHYLLGRNTFGMSYVTGTGTRSVLHPHHRPSASDGIDAPWRGLVAGGPNRHRQDPVLRSLPPDVPPARMYADVQESYASNEVAINWNAPLVFVLAGCRHDQKLQGEMRPDGGTLSTNPILRRRMFATASSTAAGVSGSPSRK